ncbi:MAG TPA: class I SAM-dependent methyltransferase [Phenylobacterium sp.]|jgi:SAM-dependent methyltransferase|uniref:class I SAM-dependent methyltransferase n=1 Tax=Phenylobacterium sp. TaxID=1871053 RepID=UPI002CFA8BBF|nr:class I SAM-dependent methyltransferase [Phenylobacterium sp.]HXA41098.1 class I SAM-dependent methyltransferase [Phenylobacterium sp.]
MPGVELESALRARDTDADWRELGETEPYWAVLSHPDFRSERLTPEGIESFYQSGPPYIATLAEALKAMTGAYPSGRALDFGSGVGRLAEAMTAYAGEVTGVDISPGMLALARARGSKVTYADRIPDGPFDWINSFIVFQHIPPPRGEAIIEELLSKLSPGGVVSLQIIVWRDKNREWPAETGWRKLIAGQLRRKRVRELPVGQILMYDYDLSRVVRLLNLAGIEEIRLVSTNHDGHHGFIILGQKTAPASFS